MNDTKSVPRIPPPPPPKKKKDPKKSPMETNVNYQCHIHPRRQILVINVTFMSLITKQHLPPPPQPFSFLLAWLWEENLWNKNKCNHNMALHTTGYNQHLNNTCVQTSNSYNQHMTKQFPNSKYISPPQPPQQHCRYYCLHISQFTKRNTI